MKENLIQFINKTAGKFLVIHPSSFKSWNTISFLISIPQIAGKNLIVVTDNSPKVDSSFSTPLPPDLYVNYSDIGDSTTLRDVISA